MELASENSLRTSQLGSAGLLHVIGVSEVRINELPGGRVTWEAPTEGLTNTLVQPLEEVARLNGLQQTFQLGIGVSPATVASHVSQRDRQRHLPLILIGDISLKQPRAHMPGLARILASRQVRQGPSEFLGENSIQIHQALMARAVEAARPPGNACRQLAALRRLVLIRIDASVVNENHGVQQLDGLVVAVDLDRAEANRFQADVDADAVADTRNVF